MKVRIVLFAALLLVPLLAQASSPVVVEVGYIGQGHYMFKKQPYDHAGLVQAIQAKYQDQHIDLISVHVVAGASVAERRDICLLRGELGTNLKMHVEVGDGTDATREQFCH